MPSRTFKRHQKAIDKLVKEYQDDERFPALIIGGSVAKGLAREDSDVDFMIVAKDEEFKKRSGSGELFINRSDLTDYPGGFVDGKIIDLEYLREVAAKGNEPTRAAFDGAFMAYSHIGDLEDLVRTINQYPETGRSQRIKSFYSMSFIQNWLMGEASRHDNLYTQTRAASQLVLFAGRLILAHNRVLFPYHKWFMAYLEQCPEKPRHFMEHIDVLLKEPNLKNANNLFQGLQDFRDWGVPDLDAYHWFMEEVEWSWRKGQTSWEDL